jgi:hypothetical protein
LMPGLWEACLTILINCLVLASGVANMEGGQVVRAGPSVANFMTMVLDARKPINTFAKLLVDKHTNVRALRKRAAEELYEVANTLTPYGQISEVTTMTGSSGTVAWHHLNIFAFFYMLAAESSAFFELMKWCVERADGGCLSLCLYTDEVVPRNKLRPDMGGKYQAVYFQVLDFPDFIRSRLPLRWFTFGYVSCRELEEAGIGVGQLNRVVLNSWFGQHWNLKGTGVRLCNGTEVVHMYARYACSLQDERGHKFSFDVKGASGRNPCASCDNCIGRVEYFEDESGIAHVLSPCYAKFQARTEASAAATLELLARTSAHGRRGQLEEIEIATGIIFNKDGLLFDVAVMPYISFPNCVYWDWMHNWCSSGGVGQYHLNQFVHQLTTTLAIGLKELDEFMAKVVEPKSSPRLPKRFFADRVVDGTSKHIRAFASEVLVAVHVLAMFVQLVLKPTGVLERHVECFEAMQALFAIFKRGRREDIPAARELTRKHHILFLELYRECAKPKLHYCMHVIDCWERHGVLLSCFGAESNHRFSVDIFEFSYKKPCSTALAFDLRRLFQAASDSKSFEHTSLAGSIAVWKEMLLVEIDGVGMANISASSSELVGVLGRYFKGDLVEWRAGAARRLGFCLCFFEMLLANGTKLWAAIIDEVQHSGHGVWMHLQRVIVNAALLWEAVPFVQEDGFVRPLYVGM